MVYEEQQDSAEALSDPQVFFARNNTPFRGRHFLIFLAFLPAIFIAQRSVWARVPEPEGAPGTKAGAGEYPVTPVRGPSWLKHLGLEVSQTRMGQMGGTGPIPATPRREPDLKTRSARGNLGSAIRRFLSLFLPDPQEASQILDERFLLGGADLYRLNCQACHGPSGEGSPPEINSLLDPVRGTSPALILKRMKARGRPIDDEFARQLATQAGAALRERLRKGGKKMPPFEHLRGDEIEALIGYLEKLAGVPGTRRTGLLVSQSAARVGEHIVKGTCHICHNATGPGGRHTAMMQGIISSLASLPEQNSLDAVLRQVGYGSSGMRGMRGMMGMMGMMGGKRMPAMSYLTEEEVAAAYFYLVEYPPRH